MYKPEDLAAAVLEIRALLIRYLPSRDVSRDLADSSDVKGVATSLPDAVRRALMLERIAGREEMREKLVCGHPKAVLYRGDELLKHCPWCNDLRFLGGAVRSKKKGDSE